jgi:hypothetical protein
MDSLLDREIDDILNSTDSEYAVVVNDDLVGAILGDDDNGIASSSFTMEVSPIPQCSNIDTEVVTTEISEVCTHYIYIFMFL